MTSNRRDQPSGQRIALRNTHSTFERFFFVTLIISTIRSSVYGFSSNNQIHLPKIRTTSTCISSALQDVKSKSNRNKQSQARSRSIIMSSTKDNSGLEIIETNSMSNEGDVQSSQYSTSVQPTSSRRKLLSKVFQASAITATTLINPLINTNSNNNIDATIANAIDSAVITTDPSSTTTSIAPITHKVTFNVRISRADGTFYIRDDETDKEVFNGQLTFGLFGSVAPNHVSHFLQYLPSIAAAPTSNSMNDLFDDNPFPSYSRSLFPSLDLSSGLIQGGVIPGLQPSTTLSNLGGGLEYRGRVIPSSLWIETTPKGTSSPSPSSPPMKISHSKGKYLLTHRNLEILPSFGITTRIEPEGSNPLDGSNTVFGQVLLTDSSQEFFNRMIDLPTYGYTAVGEKKIGNSSSRAAEEVASSIYSAQQAYFRNAAKAFGDSRVSNIYEGKILRRVEVTSVSVETVG